MDQTDQNIYYLQKNWKYNFYPHFEIFDLADFSRSAPNIKYFTFSQSMAHSGLFDPKIIEIRQQNQKLLIFEEIHVDLMAKLWPLAVAPKVSFTKNGRHFIGQVGHGLQNVIGGNAQLEWHRKRIPSKIFSPHLRIILINIMSWKNEHTGWSKSCATMEKFLGGILL